MLKPFLLAPMAELSHRALRELIFSFGGVDEYFTEMINAPSLIGGGPLEKYYIDAGPCPDRVVFQLVGADAEKLAGAARILDTMECKGIDINMGCAAPAISKYGAGVKWMFDQEKAKKMVHLVRKSTKKRLSVKIRLGPDENFEYLVSFCRGLAAEGVEFITLHPRTAREKFKRRAKWDYVSMLKAELSIPVAGNGDIASLDDLESRGKGPWDAVMVGRLAVKCPWIFAQARAKNDEEFRKMLPSRVDMEDVACRYLDLLEKFQPREFHKTRAQRFFLYYCDNFVWGNYLKTLLGRETGFAKMKEVLGNYFNEHPQEKEVFLINN